jgi:predicted nuclease of predicted toxin-antitoxin system
MPWIDTVEWARANPPSKKEIDQVIEYGRRRAKARFYADENFPTDAVRVLREIGCRVTTVQEVNRRGHPDENHAAYALRNGLILLTCDRDYLDERRFPLVHCPAIVVFDFGRGQPSEAVIRSAMKCLRVAIRFPQVYDKWVKIDARRNSWTEYIRFLNGTTAKTRYRISAGALQQWVEA